MCPLTLYDVVRRRRIEINSGDFQVSTNISETTGAISFKLGIQGRVYGPTKIYKFDRNRPNSSRLKSARSWCA